MELELKHIAPYLSYELNFRAKGENWQLTSLHTLEEYQVWASNYFDEKTLKYTPEINNKDTCIGRGFMLRKIKPILRPLSDLNKEIEVNGKNVLPINLFYSFTSVDLELIDVNEWHEELIHNLKNNYPFQLSQFNILFELHFDVFGLIENGLAIDINTL